MSVSNIKLTLRTSPADEPPIVSGGSSGDPADTHLEMKGIQLRGAPMYLDMQATTPLDPRVLDTMLPYLTEQYGNPHSRTHMYGWESEDAVELARKQVLLPSQTTVGHLKFMDIARNHAACAEQSLNKRQCPFRLQT